MTNEPIDPPEPAESDVHETHSKPEKTDDTVAEKIVKSESKQKTSFKAKLKRLVSTKKRRIVVAIVGVVVLVGVLMAIPATRYAIAGTVIKKTATVTVVDSVTGKPVSEVAVQLAGKTVKTNSKGEAVVSSVPVGQYTLKVEKKYFQTIQQDVRVPILVGTPNTRVSIKATGRPVLVKTTNKISGAPLEKATISVSGTTAVTDKNGETSIVLPISSKAQTAKITHDGFNDGSLTITVADKADQKADVGLTPAGKIYFLSKRTGKINVVSTNLDGSDVKTVLEGTGKESESDTTLLATRDWRYLALKAKREGDRAKLYLIDTSNDKLSTMDEGDAEFTLAGWQNHYFVFTVERVKLGNWQPKKQALKSFNAENAKLTTLDETEGEGTAADRYWRQYINNVYILSNEIAYTKAWSVANLYPFSGKFMSINSVKSDGTNRHSVRDFGQIINDYIGGAKLYKPQEIYFAVRDNPSTYDIDAPIKEAYWEYEDGKVTEAKDVTSESFYKDYPTYLVSPSGNKTFWYEPRDGKNTLLVGDKDAQNSKEIASLSEYTPYGWYSDDYLLVSKAGSELYAISVSNPKSAPVKISDYHKPQYSYQGYGYGYGGL